MTYPTIMPALTLDFQNSQQLDPRISFSRSSGATYINSAGLVVTAADHEARFDHDGNGECLGLLVEDVVQTANAETTGFNTVAVARVVGDYGICLNGGAVSASTSTSDNPNNDVLRFKYGRNGLNSRGYLSRFTYYPTRLTDSQLQALTL